MNRLRTMNLPGLLAMVWLVLTLAVTTAAPVFRSAEVHTVCTSAGSIVFLGEVDAQGKKAIDPYSALECSACLSFLSFLPPECTPAVVCAPTHTLALLPGLEVAHARWDGAPFPPRGPPHGV